MSDEHRPPPKRLSKAEYERLCRVACANAQFPGHGAPSEDAYWRVICRTVAYYLKEEMVLPSEAGPAGGEFYRRQLQQLVERVQGESFDIQAIAGKYINQAVRRDEA